MAQTHVVSLCKQYGYHAVNGYELNNNLWGMKSATSGSQCTNYDGPAGTGIAWSTNWEWQGGQNNVKSYVYAARQFPRRLVSEISSLPTEACWKYDTDNIRGNVAYDIFTHVDKDHVNSNGDYELMIWLNRYGGVWPISEAKKVIATVQIENYSWDVYFGYNHGGKMKVYSFLPTHGAIEEFSADLKSFFNYLVKEHAFPASSQYMLVYQLGTEAFTGGPAEFVVSKFVADVK